MDSILIFGGVIVSLLIQFLKNKLRLNSFGIMVFCVILSLVGGVAYKYMLAYDLWNAFLGVISVAGAFYAFIIKNTTDTLDVMVSEVEDEEDNHIDQALNEPQG